MVNQIALPSVNTSSLNTGWFSNIQDGLSLGLDSWLKVEQINQLKNAGGLGQQNLSDTIEVPTPQVVEVVESETANYNKNVADKLAESLQIGTGTLFAVVGGVAVLWFLTKK